MPFWPKRVSIQDIGLNALGAMIAGFIGSIFILIIVFGISSIISIPDTFDQARLWESTNRMFPFVLSFITFIASMITLMISCLLLHMTDPEKYKGNSVSYWQLGFFWILIYLLVTPIYIVTGLVSYDNIMIVFIIHCMILSFGSSLLLEILNNYRYVLIGFYGSFVWLFCTSIIVVSIFSSITSGSAKLISLLILLPIITTSLIFFKGIFELLYYHYHRFTNQDQLWDIFYQIEQEEQNALREAASINNL